MFVHESKILEKKLSTTAVSVKFQHIKSAFCRHRDTECDLECVTELQYFFTALIFTLLVWLQDDIWPHQQSQSFLLGKSYARLYCTVLQHGPAFVQQSTEWNAMRSYEDARDPVTVNWACLQWLNCLLTLIAHTFYVYIPTKTTSCRHSFLKDKHWLTRWESKLIVKH